VSDLVRKTESFIKQITVYVIRNATSIVLVLAVALPLYAQASPWENAVNRLQISFTA